MSLEGDETAPPSDGGDRLSVSEVYDSVDAISEPDLARLIAAARGFSRLCGIDAEDLLQEALTRALEGRRTCERGTSLVPFICGVMKSFVSQENEARKDGFRPTLVLRDGQAIVPEVPADDPSPERAALSAIDDRAVLAEIDAAAVGDEKLQLLIEGIYDGMRGAELAELLGVDEKGLATVRKRLRRLLQETCASELAS
jgi:DNA-directed RNA polymerase specialized sigma24 family protein